MFNAHPSWLSMDKWLKISIVAAAVLLAGAGAFYRFGDVLPGIGRVPPDGGNAARRADEIQLAQRRNALEHCLQAARMVYDVHWAAACMREGQASPGLADGHAECDLPDAKAAVVNAWLNEAEERCVAEERAGLDLPQPLRRLGSVLR
jgi:hypothetical protein